MEECCTKCLSTNGCVASVWTKLSACYLKSTMPGGGWAPYQDPAAVVVINPVPFHTATTTTSTGTNSTGGAGGDAGAGAGVKVPPSETKTSFVVEAILGALAGGAILVGIGLACRLRAKRLAGGLCGGRAGLSSSDSGSSGEELQQPPPPPCFTMPAADGEERHLKEEEIPRPGAALVPVATEVALQLQHLMDSTFKHVATRDRAGSSVPGRLVLKHALKIENPILRSRYAARLGELAAKRAQRCTPLAAMGGEVQTTPGAEMAGVLHSRINEVLLWHGTSPHGALGICDHGFRLSLAGSGAGTMYGIGAYFAECSSKSDEYARDDRDGIYRNLYCLILCRVALGEVLHMTTGGASTHGIIKAAMDSGAYDAVLGDREASVGTYREFVVYDERQVYPEFLLLYSREQQPREPPV